MKKIIILVCLSTALFILSGCNKKKIEPKLVESSTSVQQKNTVGTSDSTNAEKTSVKNDMSEFTIIEESSEKPEETVTVNSKLNDFLQNNYPLSEAHYEVQNSRDEADVFTVYIIPNTKELADEFTSVLESQDSTSEIYQYYGGIAIDIIDIQMDGATIDSVVWSPTDDNLSHEFVQTYR